jgi:hypothetical protein
MPAIASFYGIIIYMYFFDEDRHHAPHIHAKYSGDEAVIKIPGNKLKLVQDWLEIHADELMANWNLVSKGRTINLIEPLR